ncbi:kv channel-interacting protein 2 [Ditylenchus destructor]|uniref:Kv channel-interacting protein 2 n=1 Tax=Ditylenchus destructor TaxID=166010 RepID=A0AAD4NAN3_9BILA|nr:kv channel-interacting protein 2 [Ditylenchus destructor]
MAIPINEDPYTRARPKLTAFESIAEESRPLIVPRPASLDWLCVQTRFNRKELRRLYRFFKTLCPYGVLTEDDFKTIYAGIFPKGDSADYAHFVFQAFDLNRDTFICFEDIAEAYSILTRGTHAEKLNWLFNFYDVSRSGRIGRMELLSVVKSFYALFDQNNFSPAKPQTIFDHVIEIFESMTRPGEHHLSKARFTSYCLRNPIILESLSGVFSPAMIQPLCTPLEMKF